MAMRQYIGARYVPRFMGTHDITQIYEALDVVDNGSGTSYIARKTVPAGTPLTNTEYWFVYGASSGAIIQLQNDMIQAQNDILGLQGDVTDIFDDKEDNMQNRVFLFLGDSYDSQNGYLDNVAADIKCKSFTKRSHTGAGFFKRDSAYNDYTYYNMITNLTPLTTEEKASITDVVFAVATGNDNPATDSDLSGAMTQIDTWLRANCPKLKRIALYPVGWAANNSDLQAKIESNMYIYARVAPALGWKYVDCSRVMKSCAFIKSDDSLGYHPTEGGAWRIERCVANAILTGSCNFAIMDPVLVSKYDMTLPSAWSSASISNPSDGKLILNEKILSNGDIQFTIAPFPITIENITCVSGTNRYDIELSPAVVNADILPTGAGVYPLSFYTDGAPVLCAMLIKFADDSMKIRVFTDKTADTGHFLAFAGHIYNIGW